MATDMTLGAMTYPELQHELTRLAELKAHLDGEPGRAVAGFHRSARAHHLMETDRHAWCETNARIYDAARERVRPDLAWCDQRIEAIKDAIRVCPDAPQKTYLNLSRGVADTLRTVAHEHRTTRDAIAEAALVSYFERYDGEV